MGNEIDIRRIVSILYNMKEKCILAKRLSKSL